MSARKAKVKAKPASTSGTTWSDEDYAAAGYGRITLRLPQADLDKLDEIARATGRARAAVVAEWIRGWGR